MPPAKQATSRPDGSRPPSSGAATPRGAAANAEMGVGASAEDAEEDACVAAQRVLFYKGVDAYIELSKTSTGLHTEEEHARIIDALKDWDSISGYAPPPFSPLTPPLLVDPSVLAAPKKCTWGRTSYRTNTLCGRPAVSLCIAHMLPLCM